VAEFRHRFTVDYVDTDALGIVHFSNYFRYFERAELALLRSLGFDYRRLNRDMGVAIPRVEAHCRYLSPCTFSQEVEVELWVEELRDKSLRYGFRIHNRSEGKVAAEGWVTVVSIDISRFEAVRMPEEFRRALTPYLREG